MQYTRLGTSGLTVSRIALGCMGFGGTRPGDQHESGRERPWAVSDAPREYIDSMLRAIVGFALPIRRLEGKWKLGQNRSAADQAGGRDGLAASPSPGDRELAARMS